VAARPIVAIARLLPDAGLERLRERYEVRSGGLDSDRGSVLELVRGAVAIVADPTVPIDGEVLDAAGPGMRIVANYAVGYDNVDLEACSSRGVAVTNTPDVLTDATAELALALTLAAARDLRLAEEQLRTGRWGQGWDPEGHVGIELSGATFGIVGMGRIGGRYAELVRPFAREILYTSRSPRPDADRVGTRRVGLDELFKRADVVSLHVPATPATAGMVDAERLRRMKPTAILVNTARGALVDEAALARALHEGRIGAAGLDVYAHEPHVPPELLGAPNCVLLPHIGSATRRARDAMANLVADNVIAVLEDREPPTQVD
jgi:glyoxylate reductase